MTEAQKEIKRKEVDVFTEKIRELKKDLFKAVDCELFERAAALRDKIKITQKDFLTFLVGISSGSKSNKQ